ncbi:unnamed protein product [Thlaspi arvense]|uniref:peptidylprolyl isomerase n=1 Tax=Thlaspi arvense TaxID=13288 RepID=A0AAU9RWX1_THLAR|nr:unnamed protein product [Thlaspi arvense]
MADCNPKVFFDIAVDSKTVGRIEMELFTDESPHAKSSLALCTGEKGIGESGVPLHYKESIFNRVPTRKHNRAGLLSMFNHDGHIFDPQFMLLMVEDPGLDYANVVVGQVAKGFDVIMEVEEMGRTKIGDAARDSRRLRSDSSLWFSGNEGIFVA